MSFQQQSFQNASAILNEIKNQRNRIWIGGKLKLSTSRPAPFFYHPRFWSQVTSSGIVSKVHHTIDCLQYFII
ncbi:hypothetical protein V6Z12_A03G100100 [Gossypium hirsutum]